MNRAGTRQVVLAAMVAVAATAMIKGRGTTGRFRQWWALGVLGFVLSLIADVAPEVAGPLAILIAVAYVSGASGAIDSFLNGVLPRTAAGQQTVRASVPANRPGGSGLGVQGIAYR